MSEVITHYRKMNQDDWKVIGKTGYNNLLATGKICKEKGDRVIVSTDSILRVDCYSDKHGLIQHLYVKTEV